MKAMYINAPGQVEIKDVEMPVRKEGEVLLKLLYRGSAEVIWVLPRDLAYSLSQDPGHEFSCGSDRGR